MNYVKKLLANLQSVFIDATKKVGVYLTDRINALFATTSVSRLQNEQRSHNAGEFDHGEPGTHNAGELDHNEPGTHNAGELDHNEPDTHNAGELDHNEPGTHNAGEFDFDERSSESSTPDNPSKERLVVNNNRIKP